MPFHQMKWIGSVTAGRDEWIMTSPFRESYPLPEVSRLLGVARSWLRPYVEDGTLTGSNSTADEPIDHDKLVLWIEYLQYRDMRSRVKQALALEMSPVLGQYVCTRG